MVKEKRKNIDGKERQRWNRDAGDMGELVKVERDIYVGREG